MSRPSPEIPELPAEDDIDLRELGAALLRHRLWVLVFTVLGVVFGGLVAIDQKPTSKICLIVNTSEGPSLRREQSIDIAADQGSVPRTNFRPYVTLPIESSLGEVIYALKSSLSRLGSYRLAKDVSIEQLTIGKTISATQVAACGFAQSVSESRRMKNVLKSIENLYRQEVLERSQRFVYVVSPSKFWTQVRQEPIQDPQKIRFLLLGGIGGFMAGCIAALIADRHRNRVYSLSQLLGVLGYPLVAKLPPWPWDLPGARSEIAQLAMQMDPALPWFVFSIGREHPVIVHLVDALHGLACGVDLQNVRPLLIAPVMPPDPLRPVGVLVVVERGFNSLAALQEARRVLASLSFVQVVGVVLIGEPLPPELRL